MNIEITPLKKRTMQGVLYTRLEEIEKIIVETLNLPFEDFIERLKHKNRHYPKYLPSEVVVHRLRATRHNNTDGSSFNRVGSITLGSTNFDC